MTENITCQHCPGMQLFLLLILPSLLVQASVHFCPPPNIFFPHPKSHQPQVSWLMYVQYLSVAAAVFACMAHYKALWPLLTNDRFLPVISLLQPLFQYKHGQSRTKINRQYQTLEAAISCPFHL